MAGDAINNLSEKILSAVVERQVSEKLGGILRDLGEFTKGMSPSGVREVKILVLAMIKHGCEDFHRKMQNRIEKGQSE